MRIISKAIILTTFLTFLAACGQKGPLIVEQPPAVIQTEEPAETK